MSGNGLGNVADIVQHVGRSALQIIAPLVVGTRVGIEGRVTSLTDGRRGLWHNALCMLHHVHLPLEVTHSWFEFIRLTLCLIQVHVLSASQLHILAGRRGCAAACMIATRTLQFRGRLLGEVIADGTHCLTATTPNAAIAAAASAAAALRCAACTAADSAAVVAATVAERATLCGSRVGAATAASAAATATATALGAAVDAGVQCAIHIQLEVTRTAAHVVQEYIC